MSKYLHLLSCNYLKNIVKSLKFENKYVKLQRKFLRIRKFETNLFTGRNDTMPSIKQDHSNPTRS